MNSRGTQFAAYLETLSREERQRIERAEREFVSRSNGFASPQRTAYRDFAEGMMGMRERGLT